MSDEFDPLTLHLRGETACQTQMWIRDGFKKSKWKFKMAFAMKGGGSRGGLECHIPILKNDFC